MNPLPVIDEHTVVTLLGDIAAQRPDYVDEPDPDEGCYRYVDGDGGAPEFIVSHVFARVGATMDFLRHWECMRGVPVADNILGVRFTERALGVLRRAQWRQDQGRNWGAIAAAARVDLEMLEALDEGAA
jgi:hypothetical protein